MRGSLKQRYKGSWSLIFDDYVIDPQTGGRTRKRKWMTFKGTRKQAETKLNDIVRSVDRGEFVEPSTLTLGEWLRTWLSGIEAHCRPATFVRYSGIVAQIQQADVANIALQALRPSHVERYYSTIPHSASTRTLHHTIIQQALRKARVMAL